MGYFFLTVSTMVNVEYVWRVLETQLKLNTQLDIDIDIYIYNYKLVFKHRKYVIIWLFGVIKYCSKAPTPAL